jgi:hypothetical protein
MRWRGRRASIRRSTPAPVPVRRGRGLYAVDLALDARLFGRVRLLSIAAAIDVAEPVDQPVAAREPRHRSGRSTSPPLLAGTTRPRTAQGSNGSTPHRRVDAEALLGDAERGLESTSGSVSSPL